MSTATVAGLGIGAFLALDASAISQGSANLRRGAGRLRDDGAQVAAGWKGLEAVYESPVAPALVSAMEPVGQVTSGMSGAMQSASVALDDYARAVESLQARHRSVAVDAAGFSRAAASRPDWQSEPSLLARQKSLQRSVSTMQSDFEDAREQCVAILDGIVAPTVQVTGTFTTSGTGLWDPKKLSSTSSLESMTPVRVNVWWTSLSPAAQSMYLATEPRLIGGLDGIPSSVRDMANRSRLDRELARLTAERDALNYAERTSSWTQQSEELDRRINAIATVRRVLKRPDRLLLNCDLTGPEVLAAVAVGNPDYADRIGVLVGGKGTTVEGALAKTDTSAQLLRARAGMVGGYLEREVVVIGWLGYAAPPTLADAASPTFAQDGQAALRSFTQGLAAARPSGATAATVTVGGHSYGALPVTLATQLPGSQVDNVVTYGGPGIAKTLPDDVSRYWMANSDDLIRGVVRSGWYKYQPSTDDDWVELSTDAVQVDGVGLVEGNDHNYLVDGTSTQHNLAAVIAGRPDKVVLHGQG